MYSHDYFKQLTVTQISLSNKVYTSSVEFGNSGHHEPLRNALQNYFRHSEQSTSTFVDLPFQLHQDGKSVQFSGGVLVKPLPFADVSITTTLQKAAETFDSSLVDTIPGMFLEHLNTSSSVIVDKKVKPQLVPNANFVAHDIRWKCNCSRKLVVSSLKGNIEVVNAILEEEKQPMQTKKSFSVDCPCCRTSYEILFSEIV